MDIVFRKFLGALRERRFDIAGLALFHMIWRLPEYLMDTIFYLTTFDLLRYTFVLGGLIWVYRTFSVLNNVRDILIELLIWMIVAYFSLITAKAIHTLMRRQIHRTYGLLEQYHPPKGKTKPVYTSESLSQLLEDNPATAFELDDDGELIPIQRQR